MKLKLLFISISLALLVACSSSKKTVTTEAPAKEEVNAAPEKPVFHGSETKLNDLVHTRLEVKFNWQKQQMDGKATITLHPHFYATDSLTLDARGMEIREVSLINGSDKTKLKYD